MDLLPSRNKSITRRAVKRLSSNICIFALPLCVLFTFLPFVLQAQEINIGFPIVQEKLPENYSYNPIFLTARFPLFAQPEKRLQYYIEPQFALSFPPDDISMAVEFGSNIGIQYSLLKTNKQQIKAALGVGPHYTSLETSLQHKGFLFSDNIEIGYYQILQDNWGILLKGRFRHLSNANLFQPNKGLDNFFVLFGIFWKGNP